MTLLSHNSPHLVQDLFHPLSLPWQLFHPRKKTQTFANNFVCHQDQLTVLWKHTSSAKGVFVKEDISPHVALQEINKSAIHLIFRLLKSQDATTVMVGERIRYEGTFVSMHDSAMISVDVTSIGLKVIEGRVLFAGEPCPLSILYHCKLKNGDHMYGTVVWP